MKKGLKQFAFIIFSLVVALTMVGCKKKTTKTEPQKTNPPQSSTTTTKNGGESQTQTQPTQKVLKQLNLKSEPTKTSIFMDELDTSDLLQGAVFEAQYSDGSKKTLNLSELSVTMPEDGITLGDNEITVSYEEAGVKKSFVLSIFLKLKGKEDVEEYLVFVFDQTGDETLCQVPPLPEGTKLYDMLGEEIVPQEGKISYSGAGELFLKAVTGDDETYVLVKVGHLIKTEEDFAKINEDLEGYYILHNDIIFNIKKVSPVIGQISMTEVEGSEDKLPDFNDSSNKPFNGTFDGNGFSLIQYNLYVPEGIAYHNKEAWGLGIFDYVGEDGIVKDLSLKSCSVDGGQNTSLLCGVNKGYIENIVVEDSNYLYSNYNRGAAISAFNYGVVQNIICRLTKFYAKNEHTLDLPITLFENKSQEIANGFIDRLNHSEDLPNGFKYYEGLGMALVNPYFFAIVNEYGSELKLGERYEIKIAANKGINPVFVVLLNGETDSDLTIVKDETDGKYYLSFEPGVLEADDVVTILAAYPSLDFENGEIKTVDLKDIFVKPADVVSVELKAPINVIEGLDIDITGAKLVFTYSDSTTKELDVLHQVGFDKTKGVGAQTIKLFYGEAQDLFVECEVNIVAKEATGIEVRKTESAKASYQKDEALSLDGYTVVVKYNNNTESEPIALTSQMIDQTSYDMSEASEYNVKVTYEGFDATFKIVVTSATLDSLAVSGSLKDYNFKYGDTLTAADFENVVVKAIYSDNSEVVLSFSDYTLSYNFQVLGLSNITIIYEGLEQSAFMVNVEDYEKSFSVELNELGENDKFIYDIANETDNFKDFFKSVKVTMASGAVNELTGSDLDLVWPVGMKSGACQLGFKLVDSVAHETIVETENKFDVEVWYQIITQAQFFAIADNMAGYYLLGNDIAFEGWRLPIGAAPLNRVKVNEEEYNYPFEGEGYGSADGQIGVPFTGKFDGQNHTLSNVKINVDGYTAYGVAIFGWIGETGIVQNLKITNSIVQGWQNLGFLVGRLDGTIRDISIYNSVIESRGGAWAKLSIVAFKGGSGVVDYVYAINVAGSCIVNEVKTPLEILGIVRDESGYNYGPEKVTHTYCGPAYPVDIKSIDTQYISVEQGEELDLSKVFITVELCDGTEIQTHPTSIVGELDTSTLGEKEVYFKYYANGHYSVRLGIVTVTERLNKMVAQLKEGKTGVVIPYNNGWDLANVTNWSDIITIKINDETTTDMTGITVIADKLSGNDVAVYFNKEGHTSSKVIMAVDLEIKDYESFMAINDNPNGRFIVTKDIMFSSSQKTTNPSYIMAPFSGYIDGQDHYIFEFNIDTTSSNAGLFKGTDDNRMTGTIKNLRLLGEVKSTASYVGGICMRNDGVIENCYVNIITTGDTNVGGIVNNNYGTISGCLVLGNVIGNDKVGGIVRKTQAGGITENCVAINYGNTGAHASDPAGTETNINSVPVIGVIDSNTFGISDYFYSQLTTYTFKQLKVVWNDNPTQEVTECALNYEFNINDIKFDIIDNDGVKFNNYEIKSVKVNTSVAGENIPLVITFKVGYQQITTHTIYITVTEQND